MPEGCQGPAMWTGWQALGLLESVVVAGGLRRGRFDGLAKEMRARFGFEGGAGDLAGGEGS